VDKLCRILEISRSGYYAWVNRGLSKRELNNQEVLRALLRLHEKYPAMGLNSLFYLLRQQGIVCGRSRLHRLMKRYNIHSVRRKAYRATTNSNHKCPIAPNLLMRQFHAAGPGMVWVGDITYIPTDEGWLYLAIVKDLCTKKIVGYAFSDKIDTALTLSALQMAIRRCKPDASLIFHSDRGIQYASQAYRNALAQYGIRQSMSRRGDPYDNAVAENFFSCLKCELIYLSHFRTREEAKLEIFAYIECFYNAIRPHSGADWLSPNAFEKSLRAHFAA
jgi:putative transposase